MKVDPQTIAGTITCETCQDTVSCLNSNDTIVFEGIHSAVQKWERNENGTGWVTQANNQIDRLVVTNLNIGTYLYRAIVKSGAECDSAITNNVTIKVVNSHLQTLEEKAKDIHKNSGTLFLLCTSCGNAPDTINYTYRWGSGLNGSELFNDAFKNKSFCLFPDRDPNKKYFLEITSPPQLFGCNRTYYPEWKLKDLKSQESNVFTFPNPNSGVFDISLSSSYLGHCEIIVKDLLGKTIKDISVEKSIPVQKFTINIAFAKKGAYIIEVIYDSGEHVNTKILIY